MTKTRMPRAQQACAAGIVSVVLTVAYPSVATMTICGTPVRPPADARNICPHALRSPSAVAVWPMPAGKVWSELMAETTPLESL